MQVVYNIPTLTILKSYIVKIIHLQLWFLRTIRVTHGCRANKSFSEKITGNMCKGEDTSQKQLNPVQIYRRLIKYVPHGMQMEESAQYKSWNSLNWWVNEKNDGGNQLLEKKKK